METCSNRQNEQFELLSDKSLEECLMQMRNENDDNSSCYNHDPDGNGNCGGWMPL